MKEKEQKIEVKKDCFAYEEITGKCRALTELVCKNKKCSFYKSKNRFLKGYDD